mmetsp:Transcript_38257/g.50172  ORF Transcript_38257/g.50172 Transcript_38257/m.50172 type:complete len:110 (+) Transcript_38257:1762-2091(+)
MNFNLGESVAPLRLKREHLDFDLALFNTYASSFKQWMRFVFQSIMYRNLRDNRYDIDVAKFQDAIQLLSFKREDNFPLGLFMKSFLTRSTLSRDGARGTLMEEFALTAE